MANTVSDDIAESVESSMADILDEVISRVENIDSADAASFSNVLSEENTSRGCDKSLGSFSPLPEDGSKTSQPKFDLGQDITLMIQALSGLETPEERLATICKKCVDLLKQQEEKDESMKTLKEKVPQSVKELDEAQNMLLTVENEKEWAEFLNLQLNRQSTIISKEILDLAELVACFVKKCGPGQATARFEMMKNVVSRNFDAILNRSELLCEQNKEMYIKKTMLVENSVIRENIFKAMIVHSEMQKKVLEARATKEGSERDVGVKTTELYEKFMKDTNALNECHRENVIDLRDRIEFLSVKIAKFRSIFDRNRATFLVYKEEVKSMTEKMRERGGASNIWKERTKSLQKINTAYAEESLDQFRQIAKLQAQLSQLASLSRETQAERKELVEKVKALKNSGNAEPRTVQSGD